MTPDSFDQKLIQHVSEQNNLFLQLENEVTNRRGAKVLKLVDSEKRFGLKVATDSETLIAREAAVLEELDDFTYHLYVDDGSYESYSWLLQNWIEGQSVYRRVKRLLDNSEDSVKPKLIKLFAAMFSKVADLHALSYLHGDLQPDHFRVDNGNTIYLLDLASAHRADEPFDYGGALVHFSAPEICEQQLLGRLPIIYDELAELYSLASLVFFLYTGQVSSDYESEDMKSLSLEWKRERIAQGHRNSFSNQWC